MLVERIYVRSIKIAKYIIKNSATVRDAAKKFGISKSTVHKDVTEKLKRLDRDMYLRVREILDKNKAERHIRGGEATKMKYLKTGSESKMHVKEKCASVFCPEKI